MKLSSALMLLCTSFGLAQSPPPNAPGSPPPPDGPPQRPNGPGPGDPDKRPNRPFVDMMRQRYEGKDKGGGGGAPMDQLNEEDRKRLRTVMEKVWNSDEVKSARDGATDAAKKYRDVMHEAALKVDPSLAPLLEKIKGNMERMPMAGGFPQGQPGQPGPGNGPGPQGPPNPNANPSPNPGGNPRGEGPDGRPMNRGEVRGEGRVEGRGEGAPRLFGLEPADLQKLPEAQRERLRGAFEKVMQHPEVKSAREATESAEGEAKREAFRKMREAIKSVAEKEFPDLTKMVETLRTQPGAGRGNGGGDGEGRRPFRPAADGTAPPPPPASGQAPPADTPGAPENAPPK